MIRRNHSFLQSLALVMRARMLGVRAQTVKVEACVCKSATKQHLAVAWLHLPNQPNTDLLHVLGLASHRPGSLVRSWLIREENQSGPKKIK